jgi:hypothetical protein
MEVDAGMGHEQGAAPATNFTAVSSGSGANRSGAAIGAKAAGRSPTAKPSERERVHDPAGTGRRHEPAAEAVFADQAVRTALDHRRWSAIISTT